MKLFLGVGAILVALVLGVELVPPYWANYQFEDAIKNQAVLSTNSMQTEADIRELVYKKAQELEIPIHKEDIKVVRVGTMSTGYVAIEAPYTVHVDIPGYPMDLQFDPSSKNKGAM